MPRRISILSIAIMLASVGALLGGSAHAQTWTITAIDAGGDVGRYPDLRVDSSGNLHVVYVRNDNHTLKAISRVGGIWGTPAVIDNSGTVDVAGCLALDASGNRKAAYHRSDTGALWYAGSEPVRAWTTTTVVQQGDVGQSLALIQQPAGEFGVAYRNQTTGALVQIHWAGGVWGAPAVVDPGPDHAQSLDIGYRPGEGYVLSEYAADYGALMLADPTLHSRQWNIQAATTQADDVGRDLTLLVPSDGNLTAAFRNQTRGSLQYIRHTGGIWSAPVTVDPGPNRGLYFDIAERPGLGFAFSEYSPTEGSLLLADPVLNARSWNTSQIASGDDDMGRDISLLATPDGVLAASYRNVTQGSLQQIRKEAGVWTSPITVDPGPNRGSFSDMAHLPSGGYCLSEYDTGEGSLLLAHPSLHARLFGIERIDGVQNAGRQLSLLPSASGRLDCTYLTQETDGRLKLKVAEIVPHYAFIVRTVADSVSMTSNAQVTPDIFVTATHSWFISYRKDGPNDLYMASTDNFQLLPADAPDAPEVGASGPPASTFLEGGYPNPARAQFHIRYSSAAAYPFGQPM